MTTLSDIARITSGGTPSKSNITYWNGTIPWLSPKEMNSFRGTTEAQVTTSAIGNGTRLSGAPSIFIAVRGMSLHNEIRIAYSEKAIAFNQDVKAIEVLKGDPKYIYYHLLASRPQFLEKVESSGHGTGVLPTEILSSYELFLPPLPEQKRIAHILGSLDDKIELNRQMNETLEAIAQALFQDWFVDFGPTRAKMEGRDPYLVPEIWELFPDTLGEDGVPVGWERRPLDTIATFLNGLALQKYPVVKKALPVLKIAQLRSGDISKADRASAEIPEQYVIKSGDVIFSWSGSLLLRTWSGPNVALNQHLFKVTSDEFPKWFYYFWIKTHLAWFQQIAASKATTMGHIQRKHLTEAETFVPTADLLAKMSEIIEPLFAEALRLNDEASHLSSTRDVLLIQLFSNCG